MQYTLKNTHTPTSTECGAQYQTYCNINGQTVEDNITFTYDNNVVAGSTFNLATIWNEIQDAMKVVYNLEGSGTKGPDITGLTNKQKNEFTTLAYYNDLLTRLNKTNKTGVQYIKALDISDLRDAVNKYVLAGDRCMLCNNSCQYCNTCQSDCSCYGEGGGGGDCDNSCCMSGCWSCEAYWTY